MGNAVAWPWLGVRTWGDGSSHPPCCGGGWWVPAELSMHSGLPIHLPLQGGGKRGWLSRGPCSPGPSPLHNKETGCFIQARKMLVLLPDVMETLQDANSDVKMKALVFLGNMMGHVKGDEASLMALRLAEKLLPLFDDVRLPWEPELYRWALCYDSCPAARPCGEHWGRAPLLAPLAWPFRALGPFSCSCRSGPQLLCSGSDPRASPLTSATLTPLFTMGREHLC